MADFVNPNTLAIVLSANDAPAPWVVISRADAVAALAIPGIYRKWTGSAVAEMIAGEKSAVDAALLTASRDSSIGRVDNVEDVLRASVLVLRDELNTHALKINSILDAVDGAANLGALKTAVAAIPDYPQRTVQQVRNAIRAKLGS